MGLFTRSKAEPETESLDKLDLPSSQDISADPFPANTEMDFKLAKPAPKLDYGIEEAIRLMKSLPRDNNEIVVTVVKKTLESTQVKVEDIVADGKAKEERLRDKHKRLEKEIKDFQEEIARRNQQIGELLQDLKETSEVRQRLQLAMELDSPKPLNANKPAAQALNTATSKSVETEAGKSTPTDSRQASAANNPPGKAPGK